MKKFLLSLFLLFSAVCFAQKGLYMKPMAGIGITNATLVDGDRYVYLRGPSKLTCFSLGLDIGHQYKHFRLETGLRYMNTGSVIDIPNTDGSLLYVKTVRTKFRHWVAPVLGTYNVTISKKWQIIPSAGFLLSLNTGEAKEWEFSSGLVNESKSNYFRKNPKYPPTIFSVFGTAELGVQYNLNTALSIHTTPAFNYMITEMGNTIIAPLLHPYSFMLNIGIVKDI